MLKLTFAVVVFLVNLVVVPSLFASQLQSIEPGSIFSANKDVVFALPSVGGFSAKVYDIDDKLVKAVSGSGNSINLGKILPGYFELRGFLNGIAWDTTSFVVIPSGQTKSGRISMDGAFSYLVDPGHYSTMSSAVAKLGFGWMRERMRWSDVQPAPGIFSWGKYDESASAEHLRDLNVCQLIGDAPGWSTADGKLNSYPKDLRDVYDFCRAAGKHFMGRVQAWEIWNEADISGQMASDYAALLKASYLGFKSSDANALVLQTSFALDASQFSDSLYRNGTPDYFDIFNWHVYGDPDGYLSRANGHFESLAKFGISNKPSWLTEAGIVLPQTNQSLSRQDKRKQAEFIGKSCTVSAAAGVDNHFAFVFPHYIENGNEFGLTDPEEHPYPSIAAIETFMQQIGDRSYKGMLPVPGLKVSCYAFSDGDFVRLVIWSLAEQEVQLPIIFTEAKACDLVGSPVPIENINNFVALHVGPSPVYIKVSNLAIHHAIHNAYSKPPQIREWTSTSLPSAVVRVRLPDATPDSLSQTYCVQPGGLSVSAEIYNFSANALSGVLHLSAPRGWVIDKDAVVVDVPPFDRQIVHLVVTVPTVSPYDKSGLKAWVTSGAKIGSPSVLDAQLNASSYLPSSILVLSSIRGKWVDNIGAGTMTHGTKEDGTMTFGAHFFTSSGGWVFPKYVFDTAQDLSDCNGISLNVKCDGQGSATKLGCFINFDDIAYYAESIGVPSAGWNKLTIPFSAFKWFQYSPNPKYESLNLKKITGIQVGATTDKQNIRIEVRDFAFIRYRQE
jgi:hypothetical protein